MKICCPTCKKVLPSVPDDFAPRPFCSANCKLADLSNWLDGSYRISDPLSDTEAPDGTNLN